MKIKTLIFHCDRIGMLEQVIEGIKPKVDSITILDDSSKGAKEEVEKRFKNIDKVFNQYKLGKAFYWVQWVNAFKICQESDADIFIFMPDDFLELDIDRIVEYSKRMPSSYLFNLVNDGREFSWNRRRPVHFNMEFMRVFFTDCGFFCNRAALAALDYKINPVPNSWFSRQNKSSGVGHQLTQRLNRMKVPIYTPYKSLAIHGKHESKMHPEERLNTPLISR